MASFLPLGGFQLPLQRRLSRLYNDTKKSSDFVQEPISEDPEIKAMHRKLKIQKDRLVSWGLEWSDPSNQIAEIDESLSKAGLSDLVGSIMSTIKDILAEAEPLWASTKRRTGSEKEPEKAGLDRKAPIVVWDKGRFEDLIKDLTDSIDTLYDLSRTRSSVASSNRIARLSKSNSSTEELRPFESTRMQTPQQIDPQTLTTLNSIQLTDPTTSPRRPQQVVFMSKQAYSDLTHRPSRQPYSPLLLEHSHFDPLYSSTGIMPSMLRFEKLSAGLQTESHRAPGTWIGLPLLLGYYEDMENSRLGLVYKFPASFTPVSYENVTQRPIDNLCTLSELLSRPDFEPRLEAKFRLAHNLANTVFDMHAREITHGNLLDTTISFCSPAVNEPGVQVGEVDVRKPLVSSFDLFPGESPPSTSLSTTLYRHPLDPRTTAQSPLASDSDSKTLDLYSLAMLLVSIGLWTSLENLVPNQTSPSVPESVLEQLAIRCGTLYMKAVQTCWNAVERELMRPGTTDEILSSVQIRTSRYLEACCILDQVNGLEERLSADIGDVPTSQNEHYPSVNLLISGPSLSGTSTTNPKLHPRSPAPASPVLKRKITSPLATPETSQLPSQEPVVPVDVKQDVKHTNKPPKPQSPKLRLYPQIPLPPEAVEKWNTIIMPQINAALKHFYRKNPESVEISLESVGESPNKTTPTVLVVCTSVSKVRAILKKKLDNLPTGFSLKVCRGSVVRSRKPATTRSMANLGHSTADEEPEYQAVNPEYQERPRNGASIGAWNRYRHLLPVSFGGLIVVDDKTYGMTVHHMLDDPDEEHNDSPENKMASTHRSSAAAQEIAFHDSDFSADSSGGEDFACEFSDTESEYSDTDITSDYENEEESEEAYAEDGDVPGVEPGRGQEYVITQPALDDVDGDFYPDEDSKDEEHLDSCRLGEMWASSGIRRRQENGLVHEIDWALFEFNGNRLPHENVIPRTKSSLTHSPLSDSAMSFHPTKVASSALFPNLHVLCMARTSGLQTGHILPAISSVRIYGRTSPSHLYQVSGRIPSSPPPSMSGSQVSLTRLPSSGRPPFMGIPGDSGAWIVDAHYGDLCGHVLAWSQRKQVAYICPMEVLLVDIAETLDANDVRLPGGEALIERQDAAEEADCDDDAAQDLCSLAGDEEEDEDGSENEAQRQLARGIRQLTRNMDKMHGVKQVVT